MMRTRPVLSFLVLAYAISWGIFALAKWAIGITGPLGWTAAGAVFMLGPAAAALLLRKHLGLSWPDLGVIFRGIRWKWMGIAVLIGMLLPVITILLNMVLGNVMHLPGFGHAAITKGMLITALRDSLSDAGLSNTLVDQRAASIQAVPLNGTMLLLIMLLASAVGGCTVNFVFAMGEELGWRGMLFRLTRRWGLLPQVLFTGFYWGLWHAPLILHGHNYPDHPRPGVFFMCLLTTALALPMAWVRFRSGCVWAAGLLHGTVNASAGITLLFTQGATPMAGGGAGLSAVLAVVGMGAALFLFDPGFRRQFQTG